MAKTKTFTVGAKLSAQDLNAVTLSVPNEGDALETTWLSLATALALDGSGNALFTAGGGFGIIRVGNRVTMRGSVTPVSGGNWGAAANTSVTVIPAGGIPATFRPPSAQAFQGASSDGRTTFRVALGVGGDLTVRCDTAAYTGAMWATCVDLPINP